MCCHGYLATVNWIYLAIILRVGNHGDNCVIDPCNSKVI